MSARKTRWIVIGSATFAMTIVFTSVTSSDAFPRYRQNDDGGFCVECHGAFDDDTSPKGTVFPNGGKHNMHRSSSYMNTDCTMCHVEIGDIPMTNFSGSDGYGGGPGPGCIGCHGQDYDPDPDIEDIIGAGLRRHHLMNNVDVCLNCHPSDPDPLPESSPPFYYGSFDTNAFDSCNTAGLGFLENWSLDGDNTDGLDNDGDQVYDSRDDDCGGCPWDCGDGDGDIGIVDFLELLAQWGAKGGSCDWGLGGPGVGINEFLVILSAWGPCP